jgi:uncharacterized protein YaaQ
LVKEKMFRSKVAMCSIETTQETKQPLQKIDRLFTVIIQVQDERRTCKALNELGINPIELSTVGGFLGRQNVTLLIGLNHEMESAVYKIFEENCRQRTEYVSTPLEGTPLPIPLSTPVIVGGATIFSLEVERYEEI